jgi:hypothetical protein
MSKGYKKHNRFSGTQLRLPPASDIQDDDLASDLTTTPFEPRTTINNYWMSNSTTVAKEDDDTENSKEKFAKTWTEFTEKGLQGQIRISTGSAFLVSLVAWAVFCSWLYISDNQLGRLDTLNGIIWFLNKSLVLTAFYLLLLIILIMYTLMTKSKSPKAPPK